MRTTHFPQHPTVLGRTISAAAVCAEANAVLDKHGTSGRPLRRFLQRMLQGNVLVVAVPSYAVAKHADENTARALATALQVIDEITSGMLGEPEPLARLRPLEVQPDEDAPHVGIRVELHQDVSAYSVRELRDLAGMVYRIARMLEDFQAYFASYLEEEFFQAAVPLLLERPYLLAGTVSVAQACELLEEILVYARNLRLGNFERARSPQVLRQAA